MKKSSKVSEAYTELGRLEREPMTPAVIDKIKSAIAGNSSLLVSRAVEIAMENDLRQLIPEMLDAFARFVEDGGEVDKGCRAKTAVIKALNRFEYLGSAIFLAGAYYTQPEGGFGSSEDTAVEIRSNCALALARIAHPEAHFVLADLLVDSERSVRVAAVKALTYLGDLEGEALMRLKVLTGDTSSEVIGECFLGLMTMSPARSLDFVGRYLDSHDPAIVENAALAIGSSHLPAALAKLRTMWNRSPYHRPMLALPIALVRSDDAFTHLVDAIADTDLKTATEIVTALHLFSGDTYIDRLRTAIATRNDPALTRHFTQTFGTYSTSDRRLL